MHKNCLTSKGFAFSIVILFIGLASASSININIRNVSTNDETEYWALLIGVGVYAEHPEKNIECIIDDVKDLHKMLLISEHWKEENIKVITGEEATLWNIFKGFRWLDRKEDKNDLSLVYITTHGGQLSSDKWPRDENDGRDEVLVTYRGFQHPITNIIDDFLNLLLSLLDSKGVCVIIESCFAGGFNDTPYFKPRMQDNRISAHRWMEEFAEDLSRGGRIVLMSCREDELSYVSLFYRWLFKGLRGYADANEDGLVSAEEAYEYVIEKIDYPDQHPTIYDGYPGEFQLTEVEFPPSKPKTPTGQIVGETNTTYIYSTVSIDPEGGKICYGWDWDGDYILDEWTDPVDSNTTVNTPHSWPMEGTYTIRVKAKDDKGITTGWSNHIVVIMSSDNIADQKQTIISKGGAYFRNCWVAQSFVPSEFMNTLLKVDLNICSVVDPEPLYLSIRDRLSGDNLTETSQVIPYVGSHEPNWYTIDFEDIDVTPGKTYYIVCTGVKNCSYLWKGKSGNPYPLGKSYVSNDGNEWDGDSSRDFCFVTWVKEPENPFVLNPIPADGDSWVPIDVSQLSFNLSDYQGDLMDYSVETVPNIGSGNGYNVADGKYSIDVSGLECTTDYSWFVNVTDGEYWNYKVFNFKTQPLMVFDPFNEGWQYRKKIIIDHNQVAGNLTGFPVLISIVDDDLKDKAQGDGDDILFMDGLGVANRLLHEIEYFDGSSGELVAWVNVNNLSDFVDTVLYMYYGNSGCDSQEYPDHVWDSDYCGVWHLNDFLDSTSNNNDGTNYGTDSCIGKIGIAKDFVETNEDYVSLDDMPEPADGKISKGTFEVWINPEELASRSIICKLDTKLEPDRKSYSFFLKDTGQLQFAAQSGTWFPEGKFIHAFTDVGHVTSGSWQQVVVVVDLSTEDFAFYYNGEEKDCTVTTEGTPPSYFYNIDLDEWLGKYSPESSGPYFYNGSMDEVRISKTCRSADWVLTQYCNQNDPSGFLSFGSEETGP
jgi:hypothetical protein